MLVLDDLDRVDELGVENINDLVPASDNIFSVLLTRLRIFLLSGTGKFGESFISSISGRSKAKYGAPCATILFI